MLPYVGALLPTAAKIYPSAAAFADTAAAWRAAGRRVVFTNGCFDLLHLGHVDYLERARSLGDALVVGLNTDASVRAQQKGPERPLQDEVSRARVLAALAFVDAVVLFGEPTPRELIEAVLPAVLVKGDDYAPEAIVGYDTVTALGGQVVTVPLVPGYGTTRIVEKIKAGLGV
ncbi:MAG: D-glycero-beta-D-manno-heptose 1-phosphate adenylyltransferase [Hymenobacteraceae bacterium]|nr:D-glycero-beta-D-manno-heptose 1-phosphate adenylyltransferase [Hymenobacteraceae bacterium]